MRKATLEELEADTAADCSNPLLWLQLGDLRAQDGQRLPALLAWFEAVTRAQVQGQWLDETSTPAPVLDSVVNAIAQVRARRREIYFGSYEFLRIQYGATALARIDRALSAHLHEWDGRPTDPRQRPRFLFLPDLPSLPYLDPDTQPWSGVLRQAYSGIRSEATSLLQGTEGFEDFVRLRKGDRMNNYLRGGQPSWEAFFFFRHGKRFDENHARCPLTSTALDSIELCNIADHAPEICFSLLSPDTHILPHYGVTNARVVMHLPLVVPPDCALNVIDAGEHAWREGELMMFDDTFQHEAWNRSKTPRLILLMDCWNPALTTVEQQAVTRLIESIGMLHRAARAQEKRPATSSGPFAESSVLRT
jgi:aspartate beta-hydroxylase